MKIKKMDGFIRTFHAEQTRNNGKVPYWYHCKNVARILSDALELSEELSDQDKKTNMLLAAMGHDLYEDTSIDSATILDSFGPDVHEMIEALSNRAGDQDRKVYLEKMTRAPEAVKLIKLSDMIDNTLSTAYGIHDLGVKWANKFLLPIIEEMKEIMEKSKFTQYQKTAKILTDQLRFALSLLKRNILNFEI